VIYFILSLLATTLGAMVGIGGGIIIRPVLAALSVAKGLASFTSALAVLVMAIVTTVNYKRKGAKLDLRDNMPVAVGSVAGGFMGGSLMAMVSTQVINVSLVCALVLVIIIVMFRDKMPRIKVKNTGLAMFIGLCTGALSGFFGIGGGPFQVAALMLFFSLSARDAAASSILITLCTTASSLIRYTILGYADFSLAIYTVPAAVIGGLLGSQINRKLNDHQTSVVFAITIIGIIALQMWTIIG